MTRGGGPQREIVLQLGSEKCEQMTSRHRVIGSRPGRAGEHARRYVINNVNAALEWPDQEAFQ
jgi:hypothetical protein